MADSKKTSNFAFVSDCNPVGTWKFVENATSGGAFAHQSNREVKPTGDSQTL